MFPIDVQYNVWKPMKKNLQEKYSCTNVPNISRYVNAQMCLLVTKSIYGMLKILASFASLVQLYRTFSIRLLLTVVCSLALNYHFKPKNSLLPPVHMQLWIYFTCLHKIYVCETDCVHFQIMRRIWPHSPRRSFVAQMCC